VRAMRHNLLALVLAAVLATGLAGCAKKSYPTPPPGEPDTYHRVYPSE
jgi:predicted small lipoprotein YifL